MASLDGIAESTGEKFPAADIDGALNPGQNKNVEVDPGASHMTTSLHIKKAEEENQKEKEREKKKEEMQKHKSAIIIAAVIAVVAGAAFAIAKKLREK